eukprot:scaffold130794_cov16-Tisochrysis_lutea.AAC.1
MHDILWHEHSNTPAKFLNPCWMLEVRFCPVPSVGPKDGLWSCTVPSRGVEGWVSEGRAAYENKLTMLAVFSSFSRPSFKTYPPVKAPLSHACHDCLTNKGCKSVISGVRVVGGDQPIAAVYTKLVLVHHKSCWVQLEAKLAGGDELRPVYLLGESFGGLVALELARRCGNIVDRVVLVNPVRQAWWWFKRVMGVSLGKCLGAWWCWVGAPSSSNNVGRILPDLCGAGAGGSLSVALVSGGLHELEQSVSGGGAATWHLA